MELVGRFSVRQLNKQRVGLDGFHHSQTIIHTDLSKNAMNMILDGLFRQMEVIRDLFIRHSALNQWNQLLFASR